jgi:DnaJ-class molecular chaperone with C-terminal Zn finger domain
MATDIAGARMLLQVPKDATKKDIEKAFRNLSMKLHPDKVTDPNKPWKPMKDLLKPLMRRICYYGTYSTLRKSESS